MTTYHSATEGVVNLVHRAVQRVKFSTSLATFLEFALETAKDMVKSKTDLSGRVYAIAHATHADESPRLHRLATNSGSLTTEVGCVTMTGSGSDVLVVTQEGITGWVLGKLLLLHLGGGLNVLLVEDAEATSSIS